MFGGGFNVGINVKANEIIYNDILSQITDLLITFKTHTKEEIFKLILNTIKQFDLSDSTKHTYEEYGYNSSNGLGEYNKNAYLKLREAYNQIEIKSTNKDIMLYTLVCYSFSNQIRFNSNNKFNMPYGKRDFNRNIRENLNRFLVKLHEINVKFFNKDFTKFPFDNLISKDFVYADPPYLITCANYNNGWNETRERQLLDILDNLHINNIKFALSNVLEMNGKSNDILKEWSKKYTIHQLNSNYANANYHKKNKNKNDTVEVLITNY